MSCMKNAFHFQQFPLGIRITNLAKNLSRANSSIYLPHSLSLLFFLNPTSPFQCLITAHIIFDCKRFVLHQMIWLCSYKVLLCLVSLDIVSWRYYVLFKTVYLSFFFSYQMSGVQITDHLSKVRSLENELAEALEANDMYKAQLRRYAK